MSEPWSPTDEQIEALAIEQYAAYWKESVDSARAGWPDLAADAKSLWVADARAVMSLPAMLTMFRSAQASAWKQGADWSSVENVWEGESIWAEDADNPHLDCARPPAHAGEIRFRVSRWTEQNGKVRAQSRCLGCGWRSPVTGVNEERSHRYSHQRHAKVGVR